MEQRPNGGGHSLQKSQSAPDPSRRNETPAAGPGLSRTGSFMDRLRSSLSLKNRSRDLAEQSSRFVLSASAKEMETVPEEFVAVVESSEVGIRPSFYWNKYILSEEERMLEVLSAKSLKSDSQDEVCCVDNFYGVPGATFIGVFDGHGPEGRAAAKFTCQYMQHTLRKDKRMRSSDLGKKMKALKNACYSCQRRMSDYRHSGFDAFFSGTTAVFGVFEHGSITIANCGDSRAVLGRGTVDGGVEAVPLTTDAKPESPEEAKRISRSGGVVAQMADSNGNGIGPFRVYKRGTEYPGLAMSRSLGDVTAHGVGVSAKPERVQYKVLPYDEFVVFASDGVWQVMSDQEVVDFVSLYMNGRDDTHTCADALTLHAQDMWKSKMDEVIVDDIGVAILHFQPLPPVRVKRALHHANKAATSSDLANQIYRKWERNPQLDPGLVFNQIHFNYLNDRTVKSIMQRARSRKAAKRAAEARAGDSTAATANPTNSTVYGSEMAGRERQPNNEAVNCMEVLPDEEDDVASPPQMAKHQSGSTAQAEYFSSEKLEMLAAVSGDITVPEMNSGAESTQWSSPRGRRDRERSHGKKTGTSWKGGKMQSDDARSRSKSQELAEYMDFSAVGKKASRDAPNTIDAAAPEYDYLAPHDVNSWIVKHKSGLFVDPTTAQDSPRDGPSSSTNESAGGWKFSGKGQALEVPAQGPRHGELRLTSQVLAAHERGYRVRDREAAAAKMDARLE